MLSTPLCNLSVSSAGFTFRMYPESDPFHQPLFLTQATLALCLAPCSGLLAGSPASAPASHLTDHALAGKSDHVVPLLETSLSLSHSADAAPAASLSLSPTPLSFHSVPSTVVTRHTPTSGPLLLLFPPAGLFFPQGPQDLLPLFLQIFTQIGPSFFPSQIGPSS